MLRSALERLVGLLRERRVNYFYALDQFKVCLGFGSFWVACMLVCTTFYALDQFKVRP